MSEFLLSFFPSRSSDNPIPVRHSLRHLALHFCLSFENQTGLLSWWLVSMTTFSMSLLNAPNLLSSSNQRRPLPLTHTESSPAFHQPWSSTHNSKKQTNEEVLYEPSLLKGLSQGPELVVRTGGRPLELHQQHFESRICYLRWWCALCRCWFVPSLTSACSLSLHLFFNGDELLRDSSRLFSS